jgi:serine protease Do
MIQVDAAINSGNSGGGMFSVTGELMGIPTLKYTGSYYSGASVEGIGMCIPINAVKPMIEDVLSGKVELVKPEQEKSEATPADDLTGKPRLGVSIANVNANSRAARLGQIPDGVFITEVEKGGPADKAGLIAGDIVVEVNDTIITDTEELIALVGKYKVGDTLKVKVYRAEGLLERSANEDAPDGEYVDVEVTLEIIEADAIAEEDPGMLFEPQQ